MDISLLSFFCFSSRRRHTRLQGDWSSDVCSSDLGAEYSARGDGGAKEFGVEKFGDEIGDSHGPPADEIEHTFLAEAANAAAGLQKIPQVFWRRRIDGRRRSGEELIQNREEIFE